MQAIFYKISKTISRCFQGINILWHMLAMLLTYVLVFSGFDWFYFVSLKNTPVYKFFSPASALGGLLPILVPITVYLFGKIKNSAKLINTALAVGQAALTGLLISTFYKFFTGRIQPPRILTASTADISRGFRFGFDGGGLFWGWPSSHTTVAFACAVTLLILYPKNRLVQALAVAYALYVGIGVSMSIHWFSDFIAGAIIGTVIGIAVGKSFLQRYNSSPTK